MSKKIIQFFKTSDSDKDDFLIITTADEELNLNLKNRKWLKKSELSIKDEKVKHLKESKNDLSKNKLATNQSSNIFQSLNNDEVDQKNNLNLIIDKQDLAVDVKENLKPVESLYQNGDMEHLYQSADDLNDDLSIKEKQNQHLYQNEIQNENLFQDENLFQNNEHIYQYIDDPLSDDEIAKQQQKKENIKNQENKKQNKNFSFSPKSIKKNKIFTLTKADESKLNKKQKDQHTKTKNNLNHLKETQQKAQPNNLLKVNNDDSSRNDDTKNRRRRKQNQSFGDINDRLQFAIKGSTSNASSITNNKTHKSEENEKLLKSNYKSEDNLLLSVPPVPRSMVKLNLKDKRAPKEVEERENLKLADSLHKDSRLFEENPVYESYKESKSLEEFKRIREGLLNKTKQNEHYYVNNLECENLNLNRRKNELIELRKLKPKKYLLPDIRLTTEYETDILVYINLQFNKDDKCEKDLRILKEEDCKDELNNNVSYSSKNSDRNLSPTKLTYKERKRMLNTGLTGVNQILNSTHKQNYLMKADLSKSTTDLGLLRSSKTGHHVKSKSTDESDSSKIHYCRVDFAATESLTKLIENRKNYHS